MDLQRLDDNLPQQVMPPESETSKCDLAKYDFVKQICLWAKTHQNQTYFIESSYITYSKDAYIYLIALINDSNVLLNG
jgi:hypothetical protein